MAKPSTEGLSIGAVSIPTRAKPPEELTPFQAKLWVSITNTKPPEWFEADILPILRAYCVASERHFNISQELNLLPITDKSAINLMRAEDMYAKQMKSLAVSMRLTPQSRYVPDRAATLSKKASAGKKPWEA